MKTIIEGIKVDNITPTYKQMSQLSNALNTKHIHNNGSLQIKCNIKIQPHEVRKIVRDILECSFSQIRIKYHEKN